MIIWCQIIMKNYKKIINWKKMVGIILLSIVIVGLKNPMEVFATNSSSSLTYTESKESLENDLNEDMEINSEEEISESTQTEQEKEIKEKTDNSTNANETASKILDIASFVISWMGFLIAFFTLLTGVFAFFGIRELKDLRASQKETKSLQNQLSSEIKKIEQMKQDTEKQLEDIVKLFQAESTKIMYATQLYISGKNYYDQAKYDESIQLLKQSINYIDTNTEAICLLGRAYTFVGESQKSYKCYMDALKIDPECPFAYRGLAAWYRKRDLEKAIENIEKAVSLAPENFEIIDYHAQLLMERKQYANALKVLHKSYVLKEHPFTAFFLAICYIQENSMGRARYYTKEAIREYEDEENYGPFKPVWKQVTYWLELMISEEVESNFDKAMIQLKVVNEKIDSERTRGYVKNHVALVLNSLKLEKDYVNKCLNIIG